jgi:hypothetical protein
MLFSEERSRGNEGSSKRYNGRKKADAPSRSGEVQGSFKRSSGRSVVLDLSDSRCSTNECLSCTAACGSFVVDVLEPSACQSAKRQEA